jgi:hypothetical protein
MGRKAEKVTEGVGYLTGDGDHQAGRNRVNFITISVGHTQS